jgi:ferredoxin-type protein NapF
MADRRGFLTAFAKNLNGRERAPTAPRPPYGRSESSFQSECIACESKACVASCDEKIIILDEAGTPRLDFTHSGCEFCDDCAEACEANVLGLENDARIYARIVIDPGACMAHHGVICMSCKEPCLDDAILFNGLFNPVIDDERCTACGFCVGRCPSSAIRYDALPYPQEEGGEREA